MEEINIQQTERNQYRSSFGATVLFSGVQVYQILIRLIKSKFMALFIGPSGFGIYSLLRSTTDTISGITNLGLNASSVKTIASANRDNSRDIVSRTIAAQRRLIWLTGFIGMLICAVFSPIWSQVSFGNGAYIGSFIIVSTNILIDQLNRGELALMQGLQQRKKLAKANIIGQTLNAIFTIPLYYFYGVKAIVASLVLGSVIALSISLYFSRKLKIERVKLTWGETFTIGREMIKLGFFLSLQFILSMIVIYIIRNYVSRIGGLDQVGLYSAGTAIISNYIGLVFSAMATDYFPRLAATKSNEEMSQAVRAQAEITILLLAPLAVAFVVFIRPAITLLYSEEFLPIEKMMYWAVGGVLVQAMAWAMSYTLLAKAKPSYFFLNELVASAWGLPIKLLFYKFWGLTGFGMATVLGYSIYFVQVLIVTKKLFGITYETSILKLFCILNLPILVGAFFKLTLPVAWGYIGGGLVLLVTGVVALYKLNQKLDLRPLIESKIK